MGILSRLGRWQLDDGVGPMATAATGILGGATGLPVHRQAANLPAEVRAAFGLVEPEAVDRATAMTIPAVRRGRQVIAGTIGALPLVAHRTRPDGLVEDVTELRPLLVRPDRNTTRQHVLTWTVDDLLFRGVAWWLVRDRDAQGYPVDVERVAAERVLVDTGRGQVLVDGRARADDELVRFDGPDEGVLAYGGRSLRTSLLLEEAVRRFARLDLPLGVLKLAEGAAELSTEPYSGGIEGDPRSEVDLLLDSWEQARRERTTAYLNRAIDYSATQFDAQKTQLAEARQHQAAEVARLLNLPPRYVNAPSASGMTYSNTESDRRDLVDTTLAPYLAAIEQRLSLGDVTPRGTVVRVDLTQLLRGDTLTALQGAEIAQRLGATVPSETRARVLGLPPLTPEQRAELPATPSTPSEAP